MDISVYDLKDLKPGVSVTYTIKAMDVGSVNITEFNEEGIPIKCCNVNIFSHL